MFNRTVRKIKMMKMRSSFKALRANCVINKRDRVALAKARDHYDKSVLSRYSRRIFRRFKALKLLAAVEKSKEQV